MAVWMTHYEKNICDGTWWYPDGYTCSECGAWRNHKYKFCPYCGKPMENSEEE